MKIRPRIMPFNSALLSLLMGSFANTAVAKEPGLLMPAKELSAEAVDVISEDAATEELVKRHHVAAALSYTTKNMAGEPYEKGLETAFGAEISFPMGEYFSLQQELEFYDQWLSSYEDSGFERGKNELDYRPKLRFTFVNNDDFQIFTAAGLGFRRYHEAIAFDGLEGYEKYLGLGGNIGLGLYHNNIDAVISGSCLLGERQSSYDINRGMTICNLDLTLTPRWDIFSLPAAVKFTTKALTEKSGVAGQMRDVDLSLQPGIDVLNNLKLYLDMGINHQFLGSRNHYTEFKIGGGTAFIWGE